MSQLKIDIRYKALLIKDMLNDQKIFLYLHFATPIVQEFERVNSIFQQTKADPYDLHRELSVHHKSLRSRIYDGSGRKKKTN